MLLGQSASPFEIYDASTALLRKFQSSTYHRYASGWNLLSALYLHRLFQKAYGKKAVQKRHGCRWFHAEATFLLRKNSRPEVYTDVHFWTVYFKRLTEKYALRYAAAENSPRRIRTAMDGGGSTQKRVRLRTRRGYPKSFVLLPIV